jgi:predicted DNA-binding transcriptional regulator AlpA
MKHVLLDIETAASRVGLSPQSVYAAISRQSLPRRYSRGHLVVRETELLAWHAAKSKGGRPKGRQQSSAAKAKISQGQKKRWDERKRNTPT